MEHQVSPEPENGQSEEGEEEEEEEEEGGASDVENGPKSGGKKRPSSSRPPRLFTFSMVNSYGTANISPLPCDGNVLKLNSQYSHSLGWVGSFSQRID